VGLTGIVNPPIGRVSARQGGAKVEKMELEKIFLGRQEEHPIFSINGLRKPVISSRELI
jgi:hypothetical protein